MATLVTMLAGLLEVVLDDSICQHMSQQVMHCSIV